MQLALAKRSLLPVRHLLLLAQLFVQSSFAYGCEIIASLFLIIGKDRSVKVLNLQKVSYIAVKIKIRELFVQLGKIRLKPESNDGGLIVGKNGC